ncbi:hypothetical protein [Primorskyibacter sp. S187A]|uniref:hypothetical protein n=1 Tax=Primorskyibacter sp. S187A TaxID=3415130 RepID=UPI003C7A2C8C
MTLYATPKPVPSQLDLWLTDLEKLPAEERSSAAFAGAARCLEAAAYALAQVKSDISVARIILLAADVERLSQGLDPRGDICLTSQ